MFIANARANPNDTLCHIRRPLAVNCFNRHVALHDKTHFSDINAYVHTYVHIKI